MFGLIKKVMILVISPITASPYCLLLKNQEYKVRKVIADNDYMTFRYKSGVNRCAGSCNDVENPYFKVFFPYVVKNISVNSIDLIPRKNVLRNITFHKCCKCSCLLDKRFATTHKSGIKKV